MYTHKNSKQKYIGQSVNIFKRRWEHTHAPSPYSKFDQVLQREGEQAFDFSILEQCSAEQLDERERYWIAYYDTCNQGYNIKEGGQNYRGENNPMAKLSEKQVLQIIHLLEAHQKNNGQIADEFDVSRSTIDGINRCLNWTHLHSYRKNIRQECLQKSNKPHSVFAGENSGSNKITQLQAEEVIGLLINTELSCPKIAKQTQVSLDTVYDINRCRTWRFLHHYTKNVRREGQLEMKGGGESGDE